MDGNRVSLLRVLLRSGARQGAALCGAHSARRSPWAQRLAINAGHDHLRAQAERQAAPLPHADQRFGDGCGGAL